MTGPRFNLAESCPWTTNYVNYNNGDQNNGLIKYSIDKQLSNKIDILCLQEVDLEFGFNENLLSIPGYDLLVEKNSIKARSGIFISNKVNYTRMFNLEGVDSHIVILDIEGISDIKRIINVYLLLM